MRLAVVTDTFPRWSERFIARELSELKRRGVDFTVFCLNAGRIDVGQDADWAGLLERRVVLPSCLLARFPKSAGSEVQRRLAAARHELGLRHAARLRCARSLAELFARESIAHVHAHFASLPSTLAWVAAGMARLPFSFSAHARDVFLEPQLLREKIADATAVFACHTAARERLLQHCATPGKIVLMRHGLPLEQFAFSPRDGVKSGPVRLLAAGRFVPKKGFELLLRALSRREFSEKNFVLKCVGEGPLETKLKTLAKQLRLTEKISFLPPQMGARWLDCLRENDALVAPYMQAADGDQDGVPNLILEAFACGLPVIGTNAGGLGEVLTRETGTVVPTGDENALAVALRSFMDAPQSAQEKTSAARKLAEKQYDIRSNIAPFCDMLKIRLENRL